MFYSANPAKPLMFGGPTYHRAPVTEVRGLSVVEGSVVFVDAFIRHRLFYEISVVSGLRRIPVFLTQRRFGGISIKWLVLILFNSTFLSLGIHRYCQQDHDRQQSIPEHSMEIRDGSLRRMLLLQLPSPPRSSWDADELF